MNKSTTQHLGAVIGGWDKSRGGGNRP